MIVCLNLRLIRDLSLCFAFCRNLFNSFDTAKQGRVTLDLNQFVYCSEYLLTWLKLFVNCSQLLRTKWIFLTHLMGIANGLFYYLQLICWINLVVITYKHVKSQCRCELIINGLLILPQTLSKSEYNLMRLSSYHHNCFINCIISFQIKMFEFATSFSCCSAANCRIWDQRWLKRAWHWVDATQCVCTSNL